MKLPYTILSSFLVLFLDFSFKPILALIARSFISASLRDIKTTTFFAARPPTF